MKHNADENEQAAAILIEAIKLLADSPEALENLQSYLEQHFNRWLESYAYSPELLAIELKSFATIEL